jgi:quercetin dioxygenase-like cupin family protein
MRLNADFSKPAVVIPQDDAWVCSPESGVDRLMLDRIGDEVARATSLVRYAAGSSFHEHLHPKGEEFLVLAGVFSDQHADYPAGTYVRNPPGTRHAPRSDKGCRILVKLRQFDPADLTPVVIDTTDESLWNDDGVLPLHRYASEVVSMRRLQAGGSFELVAPAGGAECLLVSGRIRLDGRELPEESWFRLPAGGEAQIEALADSTLWLKVGHLFLP